MKHVVKKTLFLSFSALALSMPVFFTTSCGRKEEPIPTVYFDVEIVNAPQFAINPGKVEKDKDYVGTITVPSNVREWVIESITSNTSILKKGEDWQLTGNQLTINSKKITGHLNINILLLNFDSDNFKYSINEDNTYTVNGFAQGKEGLTSIVIPDEVNGKKITRIGKSAFENCIKAEYAILPTGITTIDKWAFNGCTSLSSIISNNGEEDFPNVTTIGEEAFCGCENLSSFYIPQKLIRVENGVFFGCKKLTNITFAFAKNLKSIGDYAFKNCESLININLPIWLETLGNECFFHCTKLTNLRLSNLITSIGNGAFKDCSSLNDINFPTYLRSIGDEAFKGCKKLTTLSFNNRLQSIGHDAFCECDAVKTIILPSSLQTLGPAAFKSCPMLSTLDITAFSNDTPPIGWRTADVFKYSGTSPQEGKIVHSLGLKTPSWNDYFHSAQLDDIDIRWFFEEENESYLDFGIISSHEDLAYNVKGFRSEKFKPNINIPNEHHGKLVTEIGLGAFLEYKGLKTVTIPTNIEKFGVNCFNDCTGLTEVIFPNENSQLKEIESSSFQGCNKLESLVDFDKTPTAKIGDMAFLDCAQLKEVHFPKTLTTIGSWAFSSCKNLKSLFFSTLPTFGENVFEECSALEQIEWTNLNTPPTWSLHTETFKNCNKSGKIVIHVESQYKTEDNKKAFENWFKNAGLNFSTEKPNWSVTLV